MLRLLQSTSSHISISISIFLLNIHPAFTSGSPRFSVSVFPAPHFRPVPTQAWAPVSPSPGAPSSVPGTRVPFRPGGRSCDGASCRGLPGTLSQQHRPVPSRPGCSSSSEPVHSLKLLSTLSAFMGLPLRMCSRRGGSFSSLLSLASGTVSGKWQSISSVQFRRSVVSDSL